MTIFGNDPNNSAKGIGDTRLMLDALPDPEPELDVSDITTAVPLSETKRLAEGLMAQFSEAFGEPVVPKVEYASEVFDAETITALSDVTQIYGTAFDFENGDVVFGLTAGDLVSALKDGVLEVDDHGALDGELKDVQLEEIPALAISDRTFY